MGTEPGRTNVEGEPPVAESVVENLLVSLSGALDSDRILTFVTTLVDDRDIDVTLFLASDDDSDAAESDRLEAAADELRATGLTVHTEQAMGGNPFDALMDAVPGQDAIVMGEQAPSFRSLFFGDEADRVASASVGPVLVVRQQESDSQ